MHTCIHTYIHTSTFITNNINIHTYKSDIRNNECVPHAPSAGRPLFGPPIHGVCALSCSCGRCACPRPATRAARRIGAQKNLFCFAGHYACECAVRLGRGVGVEEAVRIVLKFNRSAIQNVCMYVCMYTYMYMYILYVSCIYV